jgi:hypothetical protein
VGTALDRGSVSEKAPDWGGGMVSKTKAGKTRPFR